MESLDQILDFSLQRGFSAYVPNDRRPAPGLLDISPVAIARFRRDGLLSGEMLEHELTCVEGDPRSGPCLVYSESEITDLWDIEPPSSIRSWLENARVGWMQEDPERKLYLVDRQPLGELIVLYADTHPGLAGESIPLKRYIQATIFKGENFNGRSLVCDWAPDGSDYPCGEPLCHSEFAWVQNRRLLWYMSGSGGWIFQAWLFLVVVDYS